MAAGGPWSVKGIAPQAREAARDAARRQGKTLGEWLNDIILETGEAAAPEPGEGEPPAGGVAGKGASYREQLERLAERLEASEYRSTLAITGIDQSVRGLVSRLEDAERGVQDAASETGETVAELQSQNAELVRRLAALEEDNTAEASFKAMKSLEGAVAKVAGHVHERDLQSSERAEDLEARLGDLDGRLAKTSEDLARRVDTASDHAAMQARRETETVRAALEVHESKTNDTLSGVKEAMERITSRLTAAETATDNAVRSLEASFAHLDDRIGKAEEEAHSISAAGVAEQIEEKFEALGQELRERIQEIRSETADSIEKSAESERLDKLERMLGKANQRNARTLNKIGEQIAMFGEAVERRLEDTEKRLREDASNERSMESRLREVEQNSAEAINQVVQGVEKISERLASRIEASERSNAEAIASLGKEMSRIAERPAGGRSEEDSLESRLRESEKRTQQMIRDAVAGVSAKLDAVRDENETTLSPVQSAIANLAGRLEAIENGGAPPAPKAAEAEDGPEPEERPAPRRSALPPAEDALDLDDDSQDEFLLDDLGEPEEEISIDPPERPNPFTGATGDEDIDEEDDDDYAHWPPVDEPVIGPKEAEEDAPAHAAPAAAAELDDTLDEDGFEAEAEYSSEADYGPEEEPDAEPEEAARPAAPEDDDRPHRPLGATADSNFLAAARNAARVSAEASARAPGRRASVLESRDDERTGNGRRVLIGAGVLAMLTLAGAATLLFMDGLPFSGGDRVRVADEIGEPAGAGVTDEPMAGQFAGPPQPITREPVAPVGETPPARIAAPEEAPGPQTAEPQDFAEPASAPAPDLAGEDDAPVQVAEAAPEPAAPEPAPAPQTGEPAPAQPQQTAEAAPQDSAPPPQSRIVSGPAGQPATQTAAAEPAGPNQTAQAGDAAALYQLGEQTLQSGDPAEGAAMIRAAAEQGLAPAQYRLGKLYETGAAGVPQDADQARAWTERAAQAGNRNAMHNLALMYAEGRGVSRSDELAAQWFERAALLGATDSQFNLAVLYEQGRGVPASLPDAYAWYRIAGRAGDQEADSRAELIAGQIPDGAVAEAQRIADNFQPRNPDPQANSPVRTAAAGDPQTAAIQRSQQLLAELGYNPGDPDGAIGPQTRLAIIQYQRDNGLNPDGTVNAALLTSLEQSASR